MKTTRSVSRAILFCLLMFGTPLWGTGTLLARDLSFEERVAAQEAIERVYYSHQKGATLPFAEAVPRSLLESQVHRYLKESAALDFFWHTPVSAEALAAEVERMARDTRLPDRMGELYEALNQDSVLVQECLARQLLAERLTRSFFAYDESIHGGTRQQAEGLRSDLLNGTLDPGPGESSWYRRIEIDEAAPGEYAAGEMVKGRRPVAGGGASPGPAVGMAETPGPHANGQVDEAEVGPVTENTESFQIRVVLARWPGRAHVAVFQVPKMAWDDWWRSVEGPLPEGASVTAQPLAALPVPGAGTTPTVSEESFDPAAPPQCLTEDRWNTTLMRGLPEWRTGHLAVWTGTEMIVWGGDTKYPSPRSGARYNPLTDTWRRLSTAGAPDSGYWAFWTGKEMVVLGLACSNAACNPLVVNGARYRPQSDTWSPISALGAPYSIITGAFSTSMAWTGKEVMVWGGVSRFPTFTTYPGARYDPDRDVWNPVSTVNAPSARSAPVIVAAAGKMIVWGGSDERGAVLRDGRLYDPDTNTWASMASLFTFPPGSPPISAWTGRLMLVWMGSAGYRYDPSTNLWSTMSSVGAPSPPLMDNYGGVWTGQELFIWGGRQTNFSFSNKGWRYDPESNSWRSVSTLNAPEPGYYGFSTVWTGSRVILWGGNSYGGATKGSRYDPSTDGWSSTSSNDAPSNRVQHSAVWTGNEMLMWGGRSLGPVNSAGVGARYDPGMDVWRPMSSTDAPPARKNHRAFWTGREMFVWGGTSDDGGPSLPSGARYDPLADRWTSLSTLNAPATSFPIVEWAGGFMVVWGGYDQDFAFQRSGGRYDPTTDSWSPVSLVNAPPDNVIIGVISAGPEIILWDGTFSQGYRYDPALNRWGRTTSAGAPSARFGAMDAWTGREVVIWGGVRSDGSYLTTGGAYDPVRDAWRPLSTVNAPVGRTDATAVWTGNAVIFWGGFANGQGFFGTGGRYDPVADQWTPTTNVGAPVGRFFHTAVWADRIMLVFGGEGANSFFEPLDQPGGGYSYGCQPPIAKAGPDVLAECSSPTGTPLTLDGSASVDPDSTPGTQDDIVSYEWFQGYGTPDVELLGTGTTPSVNLPMGASEITLRVTDAEGGISLDTVEVEVVDTTPPFLNCAAEVAAECTGPSGAHVDLVSIASDACSNTVDVQNDRTGAGSDASGIYPLGTVPVTFTGSDPSGNAGQCRAEVTVRDTTPPQLTLTVSPSILWPPNHRMVDVRASVEATDACSTPGVGLTSVTSSEADDVPGGNDGSTSADTQGADFATADFDLQFRAERDGMGDGRTYRVTYVAVDGSGNQTAADSIVLVPHDQGGSTEPLLISAVESASGTILRWDPVQGASTYRVIRGGTGSLKYAGDFIDLGTVSCVQPASGATSSLGREDAEVPPLGQTFFYLVSYNDGQDSGYGSDTATKPRVKTGGGCE